MRSEDTASKIKYSILLSSSVILLLVSTSVALLVTVPMSKHLHQNVNDRLLAIVEARAAMAKVYVRGNMDAARQFAGRTGLRQTLEDLWSGKIDRTEAADDIERNLIDAVRYQKTVVGVVCSDPDGGVIARVGEFPPGKYLALGDREHDGGPFKTVIFDDRAFLIVVHDVLNSRGDLIGRLTVSSHFDELMHSYISRLTEEEKGHTFLGRMENGKIERLLETGVPHGRNPLPLRSWEPFVVKGIDGEKAVVKFDFGGGSGVDLVAHAPVDGTDWAICYREDEAKLFQNLRTNIERLIFFIVFALVGGAGIMLLALRPLAGKLILHARELELQIEKRTGELDAKTRQLETYAQAVERQKEELARTNSELDAFTRTVAHDLRAPLVNIRGFTQLLLDKPEVKANRELEKMLSIVEKNTTRMHHLIVSLLDFARADKEKIRKEKVDLSAIAGEIAETLRQAQPERNVKFVVAPQLAADADPRLIHIVLQNLIQNAWKYSADRKPAVIEFGCRDVQPHEKKAVFFVSDNGPGFDMLFADRLFEPFCRISTNTEVKGTGIGLSTVKRIIERHGGEVWTQSVIERGATFFFSLPVAG